MRNTSTWVYQLTIWNKLSKIVTQRLSSTDSIDKDQFGSSKWFDKHEWFINKNSSQSQIAKIYNHKMSKLNDNERNVSANINEGTERKSRNKVLNSLSWGRVNKNIQLSGSSWMRGET